MSIQLKQRIIGIIVGGIFIVIAVLFLFSGSKNKQQVTATTAQTTELQLPQYQHDAGLTEQPPGQAQPAVLSAAASPTQTQVSLPPAAVAVVSQQPAAKEAKQIKVTPKELSPQPHKTIENLPAASATTTTIGSTPSSQASVVVTQTTTATKPVADTSKSTSRKAVATKNVVQKGIWMVNAGLYQEKTKAENFLRKLKADGYRASIQKGKLKNKIYYRVVVGPTSGKDKAEKLAQKVEKVFKVKTTLIPATVKKATIVKKPLHNKKH